MKVKVNRQLSNGYYVVKFGVSDFSAEELRKMQSFGIPKISILRTVPVPGRGFVPQPLNQPLTQINEDLAASFASEEEANGYQESVLEQIRQAIISLRDRKDDFTSTKEVDI
jgi:hypothetical protein